MSGVFVVSLDGDVSLVTQDSVTIESHVNYLAEEMSCDNVAPFEGGYHFIAKDNTVSHTVNVKFCLMDVSNY